MLPAFSSTHPGMRAKLPYCLLLLFVFSLCSTSSLLAQRASRINLVKADSMVYSKAMGPDLRRVIGQVVFEHDGAFLYCDSAYFYETSNNVEAFGKIRIKVSDTLDIYGDKLSYEGNTKTANLLGKVRMVDKQSTLYTDQLIYDRNTEIAYYSNGGRIVSKDNKLTSKKGYYHTRQKEVYFKDKVVLTNPKYIIYSDTLMYNTYNRTAYFMGPSTIVGKDNTIYCENGWYNTVTDKSQFQKNAWLKDNDRKLSGDSLYYDRIAGIGKAFHHITLFDSVKKVIITGNYATLYEKEGKSLITDNTEGIMYSDNDSLFLHADTLYATFDSLQNFHNLYAFHRVKFFRKDLQGMCDSLVYNFLDSTISLRKYPVLWSGENQINSDSIRIWMAHQEADSMMLYNTTFIISKAKPLKFNQIKGKNMTGFFRNNELYKVKVHSNAETIYFVDEDDGKPIGVNFAASSEMEILLKDKKVFRIKYIGSPQESLKPEKDIKPMELILRGFDWKEVSRPKNRADIFRW